MDLARLHIFHELNAWYSGHFDPEVSLFTFDSEGKVINNDFKDVSNGECRELASNPVPPKALQLIRFRCRPPQKVLSSSETESIQLELNCLVSVLDCLHFPLSPVMTARRDLRLVLGRHWSSDKDDNQPIFYMGGSRSCLIWSPDLSTRSTRAVLVTFMRPEDDAELRMHDILKIFIMPEYQFCFNHPMFLALILVRMIEWGTMREYTKDAVSLHEIENTFVTVKSAGRIETMQKLRDLGRVASQDKFIFNSLKKLLEFAQRVDEQSDLNDKVFSQHVNQLQDTLAVDIAFLTNVGESVANQQTAVSVIINMHDGASMKTIAFITMFFLPATFVATLFAMPMFQFNDERNQIISRQFWLYWAVVGPLTVTVLLLWSGWWYWRSARMEYDNRDFLPIQDFLHWLTHIFKKDPRFVEQNNESIGHQPLEGNKMRPFLADFYKTKSNLTGRTRRGSHHVV